LMPVPFYKEFTAFNKILAYAQKSNTLFGQKSKVSTLKFSKFRPSSSAILFSMRKKVLAHCKL
ncbi:MAG: hypothetical protein RR622_01095, partial [Hydrogenoanaerobacterium sp.]